MNADEDASQRQRGFDFDGYWKELISRFFYPLLKRAVPEFYRAAKLSEEPKFLDKEFTDVLNTADRGIRMSPGLADMVVEVPLRKKERAEYVILHVESQRPGGGDLARRMNHYRSLINAHYKEEPAALAIITGGRRRKERFYAHSHYGTEVVYRYNNLVLSELDDEELRLSDNPMDLALYAAKCASQARGQETRKLKYLRALLALLSERGWSRNDKYDLLLFLERIIDLRDEMLEKQYVKYRSQLSKEGKIVYIPLGERELAREIEQRGLSQGLSQGLAQGKEEMAQEMARNLLARGVAPEIIAQSAGLPLEKIRSLMN